MKIVVTVIKDGLEIPNETLVTVGQKYIPRIGEKIHYKDHGYTINHLLRNNMI